MYYYVFLLYNSKQMRQKKENKKNNFFLKKYLLFSLTYSMISTVDGPFTSCENFKNRSKISGTTVEKMRELGLLGDLPLSDQMSLLDFMQ